jgi:translation initiation factor 3 subunit M
LNRPCVSLNVSQITELAGYIAQSRPEPERAPYVQAIEKKLAVEEGQTSLSEDIERRREVFSAIFGDVKGLGDGTERGAAHSFHHPDAHSLLTLSL